jgi:hypothetical protein
MALVCEKDGRRLHVKRPLLGERLVSREFLAQLGIAAPEQNALMIAILLSPWGKIKISHSDIVKLPT